MRRLLAPSSIQTLPPASVPSDPQSSQIGVDFTQLVSFRSPDHQTIRSTDLWFLRVSVPPWWVLGFAFPIPAMSCDDVDLGDR
jgi:hypothetical protein